MAAFLNKHGPPPGEDLSECGEWDDKEFVEYSCDSKMIHMLSHWRYLAVNHVWKALK